MAVDFESTEAPFIAYRSSGPTQPQLSYRKWSTMGRETGYLAGDFPGGITTVDGAPVEATVRVLLRSIDPALDGLVMAEVKSAPSGTWRVEGLNPNLRYDVVGRKAGFNDVIMANVTPKNPPRFTYSRVSACVGVSIEHEIATFGGVEPRTVTLKSGALPSGITFSDGKLSGSWPTGAAGEYPVVLSVTDAIGQATDATVTVDFVLLPLELAASHEVSDSFLADRAITPITYTASGGERPYTFSTTGTLPTGLSFDTATAELSGTPTAVGSYSFSVKATDVRGGVSELPFSVEVNRPSEVLDTNLALNKTVDSNNSLSYQTGSSSPVNGDTNTDNYTGFGSGSAWISVDLGDFYQINKINLWLYYKDSRTYNDKRVEYSEDGVSWVAVYDDTVDPVYSESASGKEFSFSKATARYVRVHSNGSTVNEGNHIIELQVYLIEPSEI